MLPIIQIGPLALRTPGLLILVGVYLGLLLAERRLPKDRLTAGNLYDLTFLVVISGLVAGRIAFIVQNIPLFSNSPLNIFSLDSSLLDPFAGVGIAIIAALIYGQRKKLRFWATLDAFVPALAVLAVFIGLAHTASGSAYGTTSSLPWAIELHGARRHPSQIYETLAALGILVVLWPQLGKPRFAGSTFLVFIIMSAGAHLILEAWRGDSALVLGGLRAAQVVAWLVMLMGVLLYEKIRSGVEAHSS